MVVRAYRKHHEIPLLFLKNSMNSSEVFMTSQGVPWDETLPFLMKIILSL
jgi:hypothetical protein